MYFIPLACARGAENEDMIEVVDAVNMVRLRTLLSSSCEMILNVIYCPSPHPVRRRRRRPSYQVMDERKCTVHGKRKCSYARFSICRHSNAIAHEHMSSGCGSHVLLLGAASQYTHATCIRMCFVVYGLSFCLVH